MSEGEASTREVALVHKAMKFGVIPIEALWEGDDGSWLRERVL